MPAPRQFDAGAGPAPNKFPRITLEVESRRALAGRARSSSAIVLSLQRNTKTLLLRNRSGGLAFCRRCHRFIIGNPLIMKEMAKHVPDAGSYAPVTILVDERSNGVHLSYDKMTSLLGPYGNPRALKVAQDLDLKVENLLTEAAG